MPGVIKPRVVLIAVVTALAVASGRSGPYVVGASVASAQEAAHEHAAGEGGVHGAGEAAAHGGGHAAAAGAHHAGGAHHPDTSMPPITPNQQMAELFVFSLLFFWLYLLAARKLAWRPLLTGLGAREERVNRALYDAEAARIEAERLLAEHDSRMEQVYEEVKGIVAAARSEAEAEKARIISEADAEAAALRDRAIADIEAARQQALQDLEAQIEQQANVATEHVLGRIG